jgi:hypothetical protein
VGFIQVGGFSSNIWMKSFHPSVIFGGPYLPHMSSNFDNFHVIRFVLESSTHKRACNHFWRLWFWGISTIFMSLDLSWKVLHISGPATTFGDCDFGGFRQFSCHRICLGKFYTKVGLQPLLEIVILGDFDNFHVIRFVLESSTQKRACNHFWRLWFWESRD